MRSKNIILFSLYITILHGISELCTQSKNGFDLQDAVIPVDQILSGGPPRDGIPSIDDPKFVETTDADFLNNEDRVLGVFYNEIAKAYPIRIMNWHEIVNDYFGNDAVVVTYCPLCGSGVAYSADIAGVSRTFGVSGMLYNSDVLLYDRQSESLWSQLMNQAVSGPLKGKKLNPIALSHTSWEDWKNRYPKTVVLSTKTGYRREYSRDPYQGYVEVNRTMFPVSHEDNQYYAKETVLGLEVFEKFKAYPFSELEKTSGMVGEKFGGIDVTVKYDKKQKSAIVLDSEGNEIPSTVLFWFAWIAFHPQSEVFEAD